jgi:hypothetical protein
MKSYVSANIPENRGLATNRLAWLAEVLPVRRNLA